jgi:transcriptional regulator with XRE-family HTH domain
MSPYSCSDLLSSDIHNHVSREAQADRERGRTVPEAMYLDRLAQRIGVGRRQLYRYMSGEQMPTWEQIAALYGVIGGPARAVEQLARECGLTPVRGGATGEGTRRDLVGLVAGALREGAEAGQAALASCDDGEISPNEYRACEREIVQAQDALTALLSALRAKMQEALRR